MVFDTIVREALGEVQCYPTLIRFNKVWCVTDQYVNHATFTIRCGPKKEIGRCFKLIRMATNTQVNTVSTSDFMVN